MEGWKERAKRDELWVNGKTNVDGVSDFGWHTASEKNA